MLAHFLPFLAGHLEGGGTVIEVGAKCGDTVAAMAAQNPQLHPLCVEPADQILRYLKTNINGMHQVAPGLQIETETVAAKVGKVITQAGPAGCHGSKHAVSSTRGPRTTTLDPVVVTGARSPLRLLKSDVDGFDYEIVRSAAGLICRDHSLIFFERQFFDEAQISSFEDLMTRPSDADLAHGTVFDNSGNVMLAGSQPSQMRQPMTYNWRQQQKRATRTTCFFDILAAASSNNASVDRVLDA